MNAAVNKGAAAFIIVTNNFPRTAFNSTTNWSMNSFKATQTQFTFNISSTVAAAILGEESQGFYEKLKTRPAAAKAIPSEIELGFSKNTRSTNASNVLGLLEGTDKKDEYIVISGHYDHLGKRNDSTIYYGADDDGSGTTGVLELAQAFAEAKKAGKGPRRSILFLSVDRKSTRLNSSHG